jgi:hypothetical protein
MDQRSQTAWIDSSTRVRNLLSTCSEALSRECALSLARERRLVAADPWIVSSTLQKAIRRGEKDIAQEAARALIALRGSSIWRRLMVIAFEDVGIGNIDALITTVAAGLRPSWRSDCGGDERVAAHLAGMLASAAKDRSADFLACVRGHPVYAGFAQEMASASAETLLSAACDKALDLPHRAVAAYFASGLDRAAAPHGRSLFAALLESLRAADVPADLIAATEGAARRTREPITVMVPLIWVAAQPIEAQKVSDGTVPESELVAGIPLYALDKHTLLGKRAIRELIRVGSDFRACLQALVPQQSWQAAAEMAAFYADAAPLARRLDWPLSQSLEALGTEADFAKVGVPLTAIRPLRAAMAASLGHLNDIRRAFWLKTRAAAGASR